MILAPGKAILCGEYAVLHGAPAVAVATDRCVRAGIALGRGTASSPFTVAALTHAHRALAERGRHVPELLQSGHLMVDSAALYEGPLKLGLGSSAAVTAATIGAAFAHAGLGLDDRALLFRLADEAHAEAQGTRGSGIDVAVSVYGEALRFRRTAGPDGGPEISPLAWPAGVVLTFYFTGHSASTPELIGRVKALAERDRTAHDACIGRMAACARAFAAAVAEADAPTVVRLAGEYGDAMRALGEAAGCPIVTPEHARAAELARRAGGAAKPSGAGGGDLGVALTLGSDAARTLRDELSRAGLTPLTVGAPAPGLRHDRPTLEQP